MLCKTTTTAAAVAEESMEMIDEAYEDGSVGSSTCHEWFVKFQKDVFDFKDKPHSHRSEEFRSDNLLQFLVDDSHPLDQCWNWLKILASIT